MEASAWPVYLWVPHRLSVLDPALVPSTGVAGSWRPRTAAVDPATSSVRITKPDGTVRHELGTGAIAEMKLFAVDRSDPLRVPPLRAPGRGAGSARLADPTVPPPPETVDPHVFISGNVGMRIVACDGRTLLLLFDTHADREGLHDALDDLICRELHRELLSEARAPAPERRIATPPDTEGFTTHFLEGPGRAGSGHFAQDPGEVVRQAGVPPNGGEVWLLRAHKAAPAKWRVRVDTKDSGRLLLRRLNRSAVFAAEQPLDIAGTEVCTPRPWEPVLALRDRVTKRSLFVACDSLEQRHEWHGWFVSAGMESVADTPEEDGSVRGRSVAGEEAPLAEHSSSMSRLMLTSFCSPDGWTSPDPASPDRQHSGAGSALAGPPEEEAEAEEEPTSDTGCRAALPTPEALPMATPRAESPQSFTASVREATPSIPASPCASPCVTDSLGTPAVCAGTPRSGRATPAASCDAFLHGQITRLHGTSVAEEASYHSPVESVVSSPDSLGLIIEVVPEAPDLGRSVSVSPPPCVAVSSAGLVFEEVLSDAPLPTETASTWYEEPLPCPLCGHDKHAVPRCTRTGRPHVIPGHGFTQRAELCALVAAPVHFSLR